MIAIWMPRSSCWPSSRVSPICSGDRSAIGRVIVPTSRVVGPLSSSRVTSIRIVHFTAFPPSKGRVQSYAAAPTYVPLPSIGKNDTLRRPARACALDRRDQEGRLAARRTGVGIRHLAASIGVRPRNGHNCTLCWCATIFLDPSSRVSAETALAHYRTLLPQ